MEQEVKYDQQQLGDEALTCTLIANLSGGYECSDRDGRATKVAKELSVPVAKTAARTWGAMA